MKEYVFNIHKLGDILKDTFKALGIEEAVDKARDKMINDEYISKIEVIREHSIHPKITISR